MQKPQGEDMRKAVKWIGELREANPKENLNALIEKASVQFGLSPKDSEFLIRFFTEEKP